jgi:hypothetical protein
MEQKGTPREDVMDRADNESSWGLTDERQIRDAYSAVHPLLLDILKEPMGEKAIAEKLGLIPTQVKIWLKRAVKDGGVHKMGRPVRYIAASKSPQGEHSANLFCA